MARIVDIRTAITRPIIADKTRTIFYIPSTNYTIEFRPHDVCVITEDRGNGAKHITIADYTLVPIPTGASYVVSAVIGTDSVIVPPFTIRLHHGGDVNIIDNANICQ